MSSPTSSAPDLETDEFGVVDDPAGRRVRTLALLATGLMLAMTTWFSTSAVLPTLIERWALSTGSASLLIIILQVGFVTGALVSAGIGIADRIPPRYLVFGSAVLAATANVAIVPTDAYAPALALRFMTGVFLAGVYPPAMKLVASWFRSGRGLAMGVMVAALTVGSAAPHLVNAGGGAEWDVVFVTTSALTVLGGAIIGLLVAGGPYPFPATVFRWVEAWQALGQRDVRIATLAYFGHMWELYAMWAWIPLFLAERTASQGGRIDAAALAFVVIAAGSVGSVVVGWWGDRAGKARAAMAAMWISGGVSLLIGLPGLPLAVIAIMAVVWGVSVVADSAQFSAIVSERADQRYVGTALTVQLALGFLLTVATIWIVPWLRDHGGWWIAFASLAPGPLLGAWALTRLEPATTRTVSPSHDAAAVPERIAPMWNADHPEHKEPHGTR